MRSRAWVWVPYCAAVIALGGAFVPPALPEPEPRRTIPLGPHRCDHRIRPQLSEEAPPEAELPAGVAALEVIFSNQTGDRFRVSYLEFTIDGERRRIPIPNAQAPWNLLVHRGQVPVGDHTLQLRFVAGAQSLTTSVENRLDSTSSIPAGVLARLYYFVWESNNAVRSCSWME